VCLLGSPSALIIRGAATAIDSIKYEDAQSSLTTDIGEETTEYPFNCNRCSQTFPNWDAIWQQYDASPKHWRCPTC
jgi:hypothetical protein